MVNEFSLRRRLTTLKDLAADPGSQRGCYNRNVGTSGFDRGRLIGIAGRGATIPRKKVAKL